MIERGQVVLRGVVRVPRALLQAGQPKVRLGKARMTIENLPVTLRRHQRDRSPRPREPRSNSRSSAARSSCDT